MDNSNTQPVGAPVTPAASTPESTPTSSTPASSTPVAPSAAQKFDKKKLIIIGIVVLALIGLSVTSRVIAKSSAQKRLDKTIAVCEDKGLFSSECKKAQEDNEVTCTIRGECTATYHYFIFF